MNIFTRKKLALVVFILWFLFVLFQPLIVYKQNHGGPVLSLPGQEISSRAKWPDDIIETNSRGLFTGVLMGVALILPLIFARGRLSTIILMPGSAFLFQTAAISLEEVLRLRPLGFLPGWFFLLPAVVFFIFGLLLELGYRKKHPIL